MSAVPHPVSLADEFSASDVSTVATFNSNELVSDQASLEESVAAKHFLALEKAVDNAVLSFDDESVATEQMLALGEVVDKAVSGASCEDTVALFLSHFCPGSGFQVLAADSTRCEEGNVEDGQTKNLVEVEFDAKTLGTEEEETNSNKITENTEAGSSTEILQEDLVCSLEIHHIEKEIDDSSLGFTVETEVETWELQGASLPPITISACQSQGVEYTHDTSFEIQIKDQPIPLVASPEEDALPPEAMVQKTKKRKWKVGRMYKKFFTGATSQ